MKIRSRDDPNSIVFEFLFVSIIIIIFSGGVSSDPQTNLLNNACSQYNVSNPSDFFSNLNATFSDIRAAVASSSHFATGDRPYALFQCRDYLSTSDCLSCLSAAVSLIRNCSAANGARVIYDGCFLRYESGAFFDQTTTPGNTGRCGNGTAPATGGDFDPAAARGLLQDLAAATPRIRGYFAAAKRDGVYAVAQCPRTVTETGCGDCLKVAYGNIQGCLPVTQGRAIDAGCFLRYSDTAFFGKNQTLIDLKPFLRKGGSSKKKKAIIGGVAGGAGFLLLLVLLLFLLIKRSKTRKKTTNERGDILGATELRGPVNFHYKDLQSATNNFAAENKLGEGGFGDVYMGLLKNGKRVAVKKLAVSQDKRVQENFLSEVKLISNVHHRNLVRLLGCCSKGPELLLVYEFMANKSLDNFLFGDRSGTLNWKQRFDIIVGIARGLAYLHQEFHVCIIHRDIKSSNILLDDDLQAKIADFGLARLLPENQSHLSTKFAGTLGYTAPEYAIHGQLSEKVDTYSFGVVVLEIVSGRKSNDIKLEPVTQYLLEWAWNLYETDALMGLVDEKLERNEYREEEMRKVIEIALLCTQSVVASRPTMSEVVVMLLSREGASRAPSRPTFIEATRRARADSSTSTGTGSSSASNATVSISQFSAR